MAIYKKVSGDIVKVDSGGMTVDGHTILKDGNDILSVNEAYAQDETSLMSAMASLPTGAVGYTPEPNTLDMNQLYADMGVNETGNTALYAHASGSYFLWKGDLVKATSAIAVGGTIASTGGSANVTSANVAEVLTELNSNLGVRSSQAQYGVTDGFTATADGMLYVTITPSVATDFIYRFTLSDVSGHIFYHTISCHNGNSAGCSTFIRKGYTLNLPADTNVNARSGSYFRLSVGMYS